MAQLVCLPCSSLGSLVASALFMMAFHFTGNCVRRELRAGTLQI
jgi:hypothetical protein